MHPLLQVRRGLRHRLAEHLRHRRRRARLRRAHLHRVRDALPDSACVYCGNCIAVCPTGALMFKSEYDLREAGTWDEERQTVTDDDLPLLRRRLHARAARAGQRDREGHLAARPRVTRGNLCIKGRFGWQFVQNDRGELPEPEDADAVVADGDGDGAGPPGADMAEATIPSTATSVRSTTRGASPWPAPRAGTTSRSAATRASGEHRDHDRPRGGQRGDHLHPPRLRGAGRRAGRDHAAGHPRAPALARAKGPGRLDARPPRSTRPGRTPGRGWPSSRGRADPR